MARWHAALVGFGQIAQGYLRDPKMRATLRYATHAQVLRDHPHFVWDAVVDPDPALLAAAREEWAIGDVAASPAALAGRDAIEVLVLATPPGDAGRLEPLAAFPNLRAVVVEKPLGVDLPSSERFLSACAQRSLHVQVNITRRADATVNALASGGLGERIGAVQAAFGLYGNGIANNGTHMVDLVRALLGEVDAVQAAGDPRRRFAEGPIPGDRNIPFTLTLANGLSVPFAPVRFAHYRETALDLWGERGRLSYSRGGLSVRRWDVVPADIPSDAFQVEDAPSETLARTLGDALYALYTNLAEALEGRAALCSPGSSALRTAAVIDAVVRSDEAGGSRISL